MDRGESSTVTCADDSILPFRFPESETALLAGMTAENAHADPLADPKDCEFGF